MPNIILIYIVLFTCCVSRAVHLDLVGDLSVLEARIYALSEKILSSTGYSVVDDIG